jgi:hypothetical protein
MVRAYSHKRAILVVQQRVGSGHIFNPNNIELPEAGDAGKKWAWYVTKSIVVSRPEQGESNADN